MDDELKSLRARVDVLSLALRGALSALDDEQAALVIQRIRDQLPDLQLNEEVEDVSAAAEMHALTRELRR